MATTVSSREPNSKLLYGLYPIGLAYEVLEAVLFWYCPNEELPVPFTFFGYEGRSAGNDYDDYPTRKHTIKGKSDLRKIPLTQLIDDPRREVVPEFQEELKELNRQKGIFDDFFKPGGSQDPKRDEARVEDKTRYKGQSKAEAQREIERDRAHWCSELKRVNARKSELETFLQKMQLKKYHLNRAPGLIPYINITAGPGSHELYRLADDNIITRIIGDGGPVRDKAYAVLAGEVYATVDTTHSRETPSLFIQREVATYVLNRAPDKKLKLIRRIVHQ